MGGSESCDERESCLCTCHTTDIFTGRQSSIHTYCMGGVVGDSLHTSEWMGHKVIGSQHLYMHRIDIRSFQIYQQ